MKVINYCSNNLDVLAHQIDQEIISNYRLWPSNYIAAKECNLLDQNSSTEKEFFDTFFLKRFEDLDPDVIQKSFNIEVDKAAEAKKKKTKIEDVTDIELKNKYKLNQDQINVY